MKQFFSTRQTGSVSFDPAIYHKWHSISYQSPFLLGDHTEYQQSQQPSLNCCLLMALCINPFLAAIQKKQQSTLAGMACDSLLVATYQVSATGPGVSATQTDDLDIRPTLVDLLAFSPTQIHGPFGVGAPLPPPQTLLRGERRALVLAPPATRRTTRLRMAPTSLRGKGNSKASIYQTVMTRR